jgi:hypothetical protein
VITGAALATGVTWVAWLLSQPKSTTDCAYEAGTAGNGTFDAEELGVLGQCTSP